jgi:hypothetical protein
MTHTGSLLGHTGFSHLRTWWLRRRANLSSPHLTYVARLANLLRSFGLYVETWVI